MHMRLLVNTVGQKIDAVVALRGGDTTRITQGSGMVWHDDELMNATHKHARAWDATRVTQTAHTKQQQQ